MFLGHGKAFREEQKRGETRPAVSQVAAAMGPWHSPQLRGMKTTPAAPLHPPKTCMVVLSRNMHIWPTTASFFSHCLKMSPVHSFLPPFPLPLPSFRQCLSSLLRLPNSSSSYISCPPLLSTAFTVILPSQNVPTQEQVKTFMDVSITTRSLLYHRTAHGCNSFPWLPSSLLPLPDPSTPFIVFYFQFRQSLLTFLILVSTVLTEWIYNVNNYKKITTISDSILKPPVISAYLLSFLNNSTYSYSEIKHQYSLMLNLQAWTSSTLLFSCLSTLVQTLAMFSNTTHAAQSISLNICSLTDQDVMHQPMPSLNLTQKWGAGGTKICCQSHKNDPA